MKYYLENKTHTYYKMDEPWKHYAKWKKSETKDHLLHFPSYMQSHNRQIRRQITGFQGIE